MRKVAIDTETTGLRVWKGDRPFAVGMEFDDGEQLYWEWPVDPMTRKPRVNAGDVAAIQKIAGDPGLEKCFWNLKFDVNMLDAIGVKVAWPMHEGTFMAKACNNLEFNYQLKPMAKRYAEIGNEDENELEDAVKKCRRMAKKLGWNQADDLHGDYWMPRTMSLTNPRLFKVKELWGIEGLCEKYCRMDCHRTMILCQLFEHGMRELGVRGVYDFEMTLMREVTIDMERRGVRIDPSRLAKVEAICSGVAGEAMNVICEAAGRDDFKVEKAADLVPLLFEGRGPGGLRLPSISKTKEGLPKTDAEALMPHRHENVLVDAVLRYRANAKAMSSFFQPYEHAARKERHGLILRTNWNQWGTLTGRFSSTDPSFQVVSNPKTTNSKSAEYVVDVRQVFIPRHDHVWYCPDYSQVEVIIFADVSGEPTMLEAIRNGADIHMATTNKIWGGRGNDRAPEAMMKSIVAAEQQKKREGKDHEDYDQNSRTLRDLAEKILEDHDWRLADAEASLGVKIHRKLAKSSTFTKIFGGGWKALMGWINVSEREARQILRWYDESFPLMTAKMKEIESIGKRQGFVTNAFGRRLEVDPWYAYRAVNYLVQSAAADLMKRGMLKCSRMLKERKGNDARLIMTIHDELIFEFKSGSDDPDTIREICKLMADHEGAFKVSTPVDIDKVTERWSVKEKVSL